MKKQFLLSSIILIISVAGLILFKEVKKKISQQKLLKEGKILAEKHCTTCHLLPEPEQLTKDLWNFNVLPNMGIRLGMKSHMSFYYTQKELIETPSSPLMSQEDWNILVYYYLLQAPDSLNKINVEKPSFDNKYFVAEEFSNITAGIITNLKSISNTLFIADAGTSLFYQFIRKEKTICLNYEWPITDVDTLNNNLLLTTPGYLHPADHQMGKIILVDQDNDPVVIIDSLRRSLRTEISDFDDNGLMDLLICEFGHNYGHLSLYFNDGTNYNRTILSDSPGAIKAEVQDFNKDSLLDFLVLYAQGDERLVLYYI